MMAKKKPHLDKYDYEKLLDDLKLISRSCRIVRDEKNQTKRIFAHQLTDDLMTRIFRDIKEMHEIARQNGRGYGGYLNEEKKKEEK